MYYTCVPYHCQVSEGVHMVQRQYHTATAIAVSSSQIVVVLFGGVDEWIRDERQDRQQPMKSDTTVLEFGKLTQS